MAAAAIEMPPAAAPKMKKLSKPKASPSHPPAAEMVQAAINAMGYRQGSSLQAIKNYVAANYKVDMARTAPFIRRYLRSAVKKGELQQPKGTGASGRFKIQKSAKKPKKPARKPKPKKPKKKAAAKKPKKPARKPKPKKPAKKAAAAKKQPKKPARKPKPKPKK